MTVSRPPGNGPGAVVVGGDYQGLGIVRSLGRRGIPVCVVDDERSIARFSRYTDLHERVTGLRDDATAVETLLEVGRRHDLAGWVLFPTRDETVAAISRARDRLGELYRVPTPHWDAVRWAWDKRNTHLLAERLAIPTVRTSYPSSVSEARDVPGEPPFAVKPAIKEHFIYATKAKAWRANTRSELADLVGRALEIVGPGEVMVQELVPGNGTSQLAYCAFFKDGAPVGSMVARRLRQHPPEFGRASTYVETTSDPEVEELATRFLREIGYYGLVELEFKRDPRDGRPKLLDVNARTWGYHSIGLRAGVDFPYLLYADQVGLPVERCSARPGVRWIRLATDLPTAAVEAVRGTLEWGDYLRSLKARKVGSVFSREDPLPGLAELALMPYLAVRRGF